MILYFYIVVSAALTVALGEPLKILGYGYSWYVAPITVILFTLAFVVLHLLIIVVWVLSVNQNKPCRDSALFRKMLTSALRMVFRLAGVRIHSTGLEKVPEDCCFELVCNHIHDFDPAIILHELPDSKLAFIAKKEVRSKMRFVFKAIHKMQGLPIDRENDREAAKTIINAVKLIKEEKNSVAIFPEGYVSLSGDLLPFRNGAFKIATKSGTKIVVCTLCGTKEIVKKMFRRRHDVYFDVLAVIDAKDIKHTAELGEEIHKLMLDNILKRKEG